MIDENHVRRVMLSFCHGRYCPIYMYTAKYCKRNTLKKSITLGRAVAPHRQTKSIPRPIPHLRYASRSLCENNTPGNLLDRMGTEAKGCTGSDGLLILYPDLITNQSNQSDLIYVLNRSGLIAADIQDADFGS